MTDKDLFAKVRFDVQHCNALYHLQLDDVMSSMIAALILRTPYSIKCALSRSDPATPYRRTRAGLWNGNKSDDSFLSRFEHTLGNQYDESDLDHIIATIRSLRDRWRTEIQRARSRADINLTRGQEAAEMSRQKRAERNVERWEQQEKNKRKQLDDADLWVKYSASNFSVCSNLLAKVKKNKDAAIKVINEIMRHLPNKPLTTTDLTPENWKSMSQIVDTLRPLDQAKLEDIYKKLKGVDTIPDWVTRDSLLNVASNYCREKQPHTHLIDDKKVVWAFDINQEK